MNGPLRSICRRTGSSRRGMALVSTLMVMLVILAVMLIGQIGSSTTGHTGVMTATENAVQASGSRTAAVVAFNMAQSGINLAVYWLSAQASPPTNTVAFAPVLPGSTSVGNPPRAEVVPNSAVPMSYFTVEIYPDASNPTNTQKKYLIESVGYGAGFQQIVQEYVEQTSLSKYEVLLNRWYPTNNYWVQGLSSFDGPVHDNNTDGQPENTLWLSDPGGASPLFTYEGDDAYTVSSSGVNWYENNYWTLGAPQSESDWACVASGGSASVHTGTATVNFPTASTQQESAALGAASAPSTTGAYIPSSGGSTSAGIYIHGNVNTMVLSVGSPDTTQQIITVNQTDSSNDTIVTTITIKPSTNQTSIQTTTTPPHGSAVVGATTTYSGTTNGVVYCDGNIGSGTPSDQVNLGGGTGGNCTGGLSGVVADNVVSNGEITHESALTIATSATGNINFDGSVTTNTQREQANGAFVPESEDSNFTEHAGEIGVIADYVTLDQNDESGNPINNFTFDGTEFAYGVCDADNWASRSVGTWENMGSYISSVVGVFGEFDGNNDLINGFNTQFNYDQRLRDTPPPYFPTTGNQYDVISWQRVASTLQ